MQGRKQDRLAGKNRNIGHYRTKGTKGSQAEQNQQTDFQNFKKGSKVNGNRKETSPQKPK